MYSPPGHIVDSNDFICSIHTGILPPIDAYEVICTSSIYLAFEDHICSHINGNNMVNKCCSLCILTDKCSNVRSICKI